ncbi:MAG: hypothetical protein IPK74_06965 [Deltaproteobacteria bacterium]|nr:hypothetical protein [Deltaproteobacteria bacterium]
MSSVLRAAIGVLALGSAFALGRCVWPAPIDAIPPTSAPDEPEPAQAQPVPRALRSLVCAPVGRPLGRDASCEELELRQRWCESELAESRRERAAVRHEFPEPAGIESPEQWSATVDEAFEACGIDAELEVVDCAEYPCAAALRSKVPLLDGDSHEREMNRLIEAARACAPLRRAFGVGQRQDDALDVYRLDAPCGEGSERFFAFMALDPKGPAYARQRVDDDDLVEREVMRWMYRRGDDLVGLWPCRDGASGTAPREN